MVSLERVMFFGYFIIIISLILMIWTSLIGAHEIETVDHPPCFFNFLCTCSKPYPDLGNVQCKNVPLPRIPVKLNASKIYKLHLEDNGLRTLEPYFFQATSLYRLDITYNPLNDIPDESFIGLERSLWELRLNNVNLINIPVRALRYLQKLHHLDLSGNEISSIESENWFGLEKTLRVLILSDNSISNLSPNAFSGLPMLETIDLHGNNLKIIDPEVFRDGMGRLSRVLLGDNQLTSIPYTALAPLKVLKTLDLSKNHITRMTPTDDDFSLPILSLDSLHLDYNLISNLPTKSFKYFFILNNTYLDRNPIHTLEDNAFGNAKIRLLSLKNCVLTNVSPIAFAGLEDSLHILDLSGNNITGITKEIFENFGFVQTLSLRNNLMKEIKSEEMFNGFSYNLNSIDISGRTNGATAIQDLKRMRSIRSLTISMLPQPQIGPEDFFEFGTNLDELNIINGNLKTIKNHAFAHAQGLKKIDFSDNWITSLEANCFQEIAHSLKSLTIAHGLSSSIHALPSEALKPLTNLEYLNLANNHFTSMSDTSFHFLRHLQRLELQDNKIENIQKGTFQGDIHNALEEIFLSFNAISAIKQHTFVDLESLKHLNLDDNKIERIEKRSFMNLDLLKKLNLKGNKIHFIAEEAFQNLPELSDLNLAYNSLRNFDFSMFDQVGTLGSLAVNVSYNYISELLVTNGNPDLGFGRDGGNNYFLASGVHSNIKILDLSYNNISYISKTYFHPVQISLTHLFLSNNAIENITRDVFGNIQHLQWLDVSYNNIYEIEYDAFQNTRELQIFHASHNNLENLSDNVFKYMINLRIVDISHNYIRSLPDNMFITNSIERFDASHNELIRMPLSSFSISAAMTLCELDLSKNNIASISHAEPLSKFKSLNWLDLSNNKLTRIDDSAFAVLPRLCTLDLSNNKNLELEYDGRSFRGLENNLLKLNLNNISLASLPDLPLFRLRSLSVSSNELPTFSSELASNLTSLRDLDLSYNDLSAVPIVISSFKQLHYLSLAGNPISAITNGSLLGIAEKLNELDLQQLSLNNFETGALNKMNSLNTLRISTSKNVQYFNIPRILERNLGLRHLHIQVDDESNLEHEMVGQLPNKLRTITISGKGLNKISEYIFQGVRSPNLDIIFYNTSLTSIPHSVFENIEHASNLSVELRNNKKLQHFENPSTGGQPGLPRKKFLLNLHLSGSTINCDCDIGWVEVWGRKKRQYLCPLENSHDDICDDNSDDLRNVYCVNRGNKTLMEVLKSDIECGWNGAVSINISASMFLLTIAMFLQMC